MTDDETCAYSAPKMAFWLPIAPDSIEPSPDNICLLVSESLPVFVALNLRLLLSASLKTRTVSGHCAYFALKRPFWRPIPMKLSESPPESICLSPRLFPIVERKPERNSWLRQENKKASKI